MGVHLVFSSEAYLCSEEARERSGNGQELGLGGKAALDCGIGISTPVRLPQEAAAKSSAIAEPITWLTSFRSAQEVESFLLSLIRYRYALAFRLVAGYWQCEYPDLNLVSAAFAVGYCLGYDFGGNGLHGWKGRKDGMSMTSLGGSAGARIR